MIDLSIRFRHINHNRDVALFNLSRELEKKVGGRRDGMTDLDYVMAVAKECPWLRKDTRENIFGAYMKAMEKLAGKADQEISRYIKGDLFMEDPDSGIVMTCRNGKAVIVNQDGTERYWDSLNPEEKMKFYNIFSELIY